MKTAMQELIEWCNSCLTDLTLSDGAKTALEVTIVRANDLLEKEKEQIADAFRNGSTSSMLGGGHWTQYYNQTYNQ
jgi:hypothetical protein